MFTSIETYMTTANITTYVPTPEDYAVLADQAGINSTDPIDVLVRRIYKFDYHYDYTDDRFVWRKCKAIEEEIKKDIKAVTDPELSAYLMACFSAKTHMNLIHRFGWVRSIHVSSPFAKLVQSGLSPSDAGKLVAVYDHIDRLIKQATDRNVHWYHLWAEDVKNIQQLLRGTKQLATVPDELFHALGNVAKLFSDKNILDLYFKERYYVNVDVDSPAPGYTHYSMGGIGLITGKGQ